MSQQTAAAGPGSADLDITGIVRDHFAQVPKVMYGKHPIGTNGKNNIFTFGNTDRDFISHLKSLPGKLGSGWVSGYIDGGEVAPDLSGILVHIIYRTEVFPDDKAAALAAMKNDPPMHFID